MTKYLKQLPVQLVLSITLAFLLGQVFDLFYVSLFYSISSSFIGCLIFVLPFMIFSFIFQALMNSPRGSLSLILFIFAGVTVSNCLALVTGYIFGQTFLPYFDFTHSPDFIDKFTSQVQPLFSFRLPQLIGTEKALALGLCGGIAMSFLKDGQPVKLFIQNIANQLNRVIALFLKKIFMPLLPLYVFGFCLKLSYDNALINLFEQFGKVFLLSMGLVVAYLFFLYFIGSGGDLKRTISNIGTMLPAGLMGFSTMSSAVTMPVTLNCAEKMTQDRNFTRLIIPSTANIHMLGDDLNLVVISMALLSIFGMPWPDVSVLISFAFAFSLAKLSCVGVPGASVLVILPVLQNYLGFSSEMISILTTIYILQDSFGTAANVMGNGAFALIIQRLFARVKSFRKAELEPSAP
jgi:Na+/H+-dicarboxylate symporter